MKIKSITYDKVSRRMQVVVEGYEDTPFQFEIKNIKNKGMLKRALQVKIDELDTTEFTNLSLSTGEI